MSEGRSPEDFMASIERVQKRTAANAELWIKTKQAEAAPPLPTLYAEFYALFTRHRMTHLVADDLAKRAEELAKMFYEREPEAVDG